MENDDAKRLQGYNDLLEDAPFNENETYEEDLDYSLGNSQRFPADDYDDVASSGQRDFVGRPANIFRDTTTAWELERRCSALQIRNSELLESQRLLSKEVKELQLKFDQERVMAEKLSNKLREYKTANKQLVTLFICIMMYD
jgi:hypothetical protein